MSVFQDDGKGLCVTCKRPLGRHYESDGRCLPYTQAEFYALLAAHDWWYEMSDDHRVWKAGSANHDQLRRIASTSVEHQQLFTAYANHVYNGERKPEMPACNATT